MDMIDSDITENKRVSTSQYTDGHGKFIKGNPGKPKGAVSIIGKIKRIFEEDPEMFEEYVRNMLKDDKLRAAIMHQLDGLPKQSIEHEGGVNINIIDFKKDESDTVQAI